jgi:RNA polymerase sigma factor (sigma-70 family)
MKIKTNKGGKEGKGGKGRKPPSPFSIAGRRSELERSRLSDEEKRSGLSDLDGERNELVLQWDGLVKYTLSRYKMWAGRLCRVVDDDDVTSWGYFGLMRAAELWDPTRGIKFKTYAVRAIWSTVRNGWGEAGLIKVRHPRYKEVSRQAEAEARYYLIRHVVNAGTFEDEEFGGACKSEEDRAEVREREGVVRRLIKGCNGLEGEALRRRYWLGETLEEVGRGLGLTKEGARQVLNRALKDLRGGGVIRGLRYEDVA